MAGDVSFTPNKAWWNSILKAPRVVAAGDAAAKRALANAESSAPVDTGAYRDSFSLEHHESRYRTVSRVVNRDPKALLIESKTGNMARALKRAKQ